MDILAICAHPDDETLGCGGALLRHREAGDTIHWLIGTEAHEPQWPRALIERKAQEVARVAEAYGMASVTKLGLPTIKLESIEQSRIIDGVRATIEKVRPEIVYLVHPGDVHTDHLAMFTATMSVLKAFYMRKFGVRRVLCFETLSSTEAAPPQFHRQFMPNVYRDISAFMDRKVALMALFASETQPDPYPRGPAAIRALGRYRGATIGAEYAEAFMLVREAD